MDFNKYYENQVNGVSGFQGQRFQKGYGFGALFKKFFRWVIPIIRNNVVPILSKTANVVKSSVNKGMENFENDILDEKKDIKESAHERFKETIQNIKKSLQTGSGNKKKKKVKRIKGSFKKRTRNIFD